MISRFLSTLFALVFLSTLGAWADGPPVYEVKTRVIEISSRPFEGFFVTASAADSLSADSLDDGVKDLQKQFSARNHLVLAEGTVYIRWGEAARLRGWLVRNGGEPEYTYVKTEPHKISKDGFSMSVRLKINGEEILFTKVRTKFQKFLFLGGTSKDGKKKYFVLTKIREIETVPSDRPLYTSQCRATAMPLPRPEGLEKGKLFVELPVGPRGLPGAPKILESSYDSSWNAKLLSPVLAWRFRPASKDEKPSASRIFLRVENR